jgi:hypothetical protein
MSPQVAAGVPARASTGGGSAAVRFLDGPTCRWCQIERAAIGGARRGAGSAIATSRRVSPLRSCLPTLLAAALALAGAGCGHPRLVPADAAHLIPGAPEAAVAVAGGVSLVASLSDAATLANDLPDDVTPIKIRVVNHGSLPVSILYERFTLRGRDGRRYRVVPAIPLEHASLLAGMGPIRPLFATSNFEVASRYHDIYPQLDAWPTPLARTQAADASMDDDARARWSGRAPSRELCRMELPEGVLGPEGELTGYLYFENPTHAERALTLDAELVSGRDGGAVASLEIPLQVR